MAANTYSDSFQDAKNVLDMASGSDFPVLQKFSELYSLMWNIMVCTLNFS